MSTRAIDVSRRRSFEQLGDEMTAEQLVNH